MFTEPLYESAVSHIDLYSTVSLFFTVDPVISFKQFVKTAEGLILFSPIDTTYLCNISSFYIFTVKKDKKDFYRYSASQII